LRHGGKLVVTGMVLGAAGALVVGRLLSSLVYDVSVSDPRIFLAVNVVLAVVALAACYLPARRAISVDPMQALRTE
jgi:putative ABC transport system permease protein